LAQAEAKKKNVAGGGGGIVWYWGGGGGFSHAKKKEPMVHTEMRGITEALKKGGETSRALTYRSGGRNARSWEIENLSRRKREKKAEGKKRKTKLRRKKKGQTLRHDRKGVGERPSCSAA